MSLMPRKTIVDVILPKSLGLDKLRQELVAPFFLAIPTNGISMCANNPVHVRHEMTNSASNAHIWVWLQPWFLDLSRTQRILFGS